MAATLGARVLGPNELSWAEYAVAALDGTPLDGAEKLDIVITLLGHIRNVAQQLAAIRSEPPEHAAQTKLSSLLRGREERFPALTAVLASEGTSTSRGRALDFGLQLILDGVAASIAAREERSTDGRLVAHGGERTLDDAPRQDVRRVARHDSRSADRPARLPRRRIAATRALPGSG